MSTTYPGYAKLNIDGPTERPSKEWLRQSIRDAQAMARERGVNVTSEESVARIREVRYGTEADD